MAEPLIPPSAFAGDLFPRCDASHGSPNPELTMSLLKGAHDCDLRLLKNVAMVLDGGERPVAEILGAARDEYGVGLLHAATIGGSLPVCRYLLEDLQLDVDAFGPGNETALSIAIGRGSADLVRYFLDQGADTERLDIDGCTPLHLAASEGTLEVVELLLSKGAKVDALNRGGTALHGAAYNGRDEIVKILLDHHADHNIALSGTGCTALVTATIAGSLKCVKLLLEAGADVNGTGKDAPLIIAATHGFTDILECLVLAGADPNVCDSLGRAPIEIAALSGRREDVDILFPVTSRISSVPDWTVDGIISYLKPEPLPKKEMLSTAKSEPDEAFKNGNYLTAAKNYAKQEILSIAKSEADEAFKNGNYLTAAKNYAKQEMLSTAKSEADEVFKNGNYLTAAKNYAKQEMLSTAKSEADEAFKNGNYLTAAKNYAKAIELDPDNANLFSNRSLCWFRFGDAKNALKDAQVCRRLQPDWSKACYRQGAALMLLKDYEKAHGAFLDGLKLNPGNVDIQNALREALESLKLSGGGPGKDQEN